MKATIDAKVEKIPKSPVGPFRSIHLTSLFGIFEQWSQMEVNENNSWKSCLEREFFPRFPGEARAYSFNSIHRT